MESGLTKKGGIRPKGGPAHASYPATAICHLWAGSWVYAARKLGRPHPHHHRCARILMFGRQYHHLPAYGRGMGA
jgi:hypothetical protein